MMWRLWVGLSILAALAGFLSNWRIAATYWEGHPNRAREVRLHRLWGVPVALVLAVGWPVFLGGLAYLWLCDRGILSRRTRSGGGWPRPPAC